MFTLIRAFLFTDFPLAQILNAPIAAASVIINFLILFKKKKICMVKITVRRIDFAYGFIFNYIPKYIIMASEASFQSCSQQRTLYYGISDNNIYIESL